MSEGLYVWGDKINVGPNVIKAVLNKIKVASNLEHTWVTTYTPGSGDPEPKKGDYWYCWGDPHNESRLLEFGNGGIEFAKMLAKSHDPKENVGLEYRRDGLCHQMANRLLRFAFNNNGRPITVEGAKGYQLTVGMYGEYGGKWILSKPDCVIKWNQIVSKYLQQMAATNE